MVRNKLQLLITSSDTYQDMRRSTATGPTPSEKELCEEQKLVEEDGNVDKGYKNLLLCFFSRYKTFESQNEEKDKDEGNHHDYSSGETDFEYREPDGEWTVLDYDNEGVPVVSECKDMCSEEECECCNECYLGESVGAAEYYELCGPLETNMNMGKAVINGKVSGVTGRKRERPRKLNRVEKISKEIPQSSSSVVNLTNRRLTRSMACRVGVNNLLKNIPPSPPTRKNSTRTKSRNEGQFVTISLDEYLHLLQRDRHEDDHTAGMLNEKIYDVNDQTNQKRRKLSRCTNEKVGLSSRKADSITKHDSIRKTKRVIIKKSKSKNDEVKKHRGKEVKIVENKCKRGRPRKNHAVVQKPSREDNKRNCGRTPKSVRTETSSGMRKSRNMSEKIGIERCPSGEFNGINIKTEVEDRSSPDNVDVYSFSKIDDDGPKKCDRSSLSNKFRKRLLNVLNKPYDRDEYHKHFKAFCSGKYVVYYPAVQKKLTKYRFKLPRRLTILRGFFFWLQYLTLEGAFQPWKDHECLSVVPGSSPNLSTRKSDGASQSRNQKP